MTTTITYHVGDVRDAMGLLDDGMVGLVVTSPPFLALRSYLPEGHVDKHREIGAEPTPAAFLDTMLALTTDWRRVVADWGSIAVEFGDTYAGSGSPGGDYNAGGMRDGQPRTSYSGVRAQRGAAAVRQPRGGAHRALTDVGGGHHMGGAGWPLAKSLCLIPTLYPAALAYGINPLTGSPSPAGEWRIRNLLTWTRPNPPVGALGDKFRPATSFVTVACTGGKRWFDLDAVRTPNDRTDTAVASGERRSQRLVPNGGSPGEMLQNHPGGAPPRDWWDANELDDDELAEHWRIEQLLADWQPLHRLPTSPYKGSHYATFPEALPRRLIEAMCPSEVCSVCGQPRRRLTAGRITEKYNVGERERDRQGRGWTDCGHGAFAAGVVLDPFGGSGTTGVAAARVGRDAILLDLDARNRDLARRRIADQLRIVDEHTIRDTTVWTVEAPLPLQRAQAEGQRSIFDELEHSA